MNKAINIDNLKVSCSYCTLNELCFPRGMASSDMEKLDSVVKRDKILHKNDFLYRDGEECKAIYAIKSGGIKTIKENKSGDAQIVGFHLPGELIGFDGFATDIHVCSAEALETTNVCELSLDNLESLCKEVPGLQKQMRRIVGLEVNNDHELLLLLGKMTAEEKLATFLISLSNRMKQRNWKETDFNLNMTRQDVANYLGLAVETVSRLFALFNEKGFITSDKRNIVIHDMDALKQVVGDCQGNV